MNDAELATNSRLDRIAESQEKIIQAMAALVDSTPSAVSRVLLIAANLALKTEDTAAKLAVKTEGTAAVLATKTEGTAAELVAKTERAAADLAIIASTQGDLIESVRALVDATAIAASKVLRAAEILDAKR